MLPSLRTIVKCLQGPNSVINFIQRSSIKSISTTRPILDDSTKSTLMEIDNHNTEQPYIVDVNDANDEQPNIDSSSSIFASETHVSPGIPLMCEPMGESTIIDVNMDDMMYDSEDAECINSFRAEKLTDVLSPIDGAPIAPIDIDPWVEEEIALEGTTEAEKVEKQKEIIEYPPVPKDREGLYQFQGIKIQLPKSMMRDSTYRYRLTPEERAQLPDDTRIIIFDPPQKTNEDNENLDAEENVVKE